MNNEQYEELLLEVQDKDIWDLRKREVKRVLKELLNTEFKGIRERKFKIVLKRLDRTLAETFTRDGTVYISINISYWEQHPDFSKSGLRAILRHELLHALTGYGDSDVRFKVAARQRNIDIWHY